MKFIFRRGWLGLPITLGLITVTTPAAFPGVSLCSRWNFEVVLNFMVYDSIPLPF